jgi:dipeptidyl aminopeptidase/acylaminoacyl peptidase
VVDSRASFYGFVENFAMHDFDQFERRLAAALRSDADLGVAPFEPASIARVAIASTRPRAMRLPRASSRQAGRSGRRRNITLFAAAALLIVGGAVAAGSGLVRLPSVVPPEPVPSVAVVSSPRAEDSASPAISAPPAPSETPIVAPKPAVFVVNKGTGSSAECGNDGRGGCIPRLWVANLDGTAASELLPDQPGCQRVQAWSPDGTHLLFSRSECSWTPLGMTGAERFYLTDASGSEPRLVDTGCVSPCLSEDDAVFSSDGRRILFVRTISVPRPPPATPDPMGKPMPPTAKKVLAAIDLVSGSVTELGDFDTCDCGTQWPRSDPRWSPDRTQIAYAWEGTPQPAPQPPKTPAVFVADADGRNAHQVSTFGQSPAWSPDGARIVFQGTQYSWSGTWYPGKAVGGSSDIYTVRPDGTEPRRLTTDKASYLPRWGADGRIWFTRGGSANWVMDADGGNAARSSVPPQPQELADAAVQPTP